MPVKLLLVNTPATGAPAITGTAQVGQTLTATLGDIADVDGLPDPFLTDANTSFQWIRVATDNSETDISGAMAGAYTLVADDQGTTIKVKVSFTGNNGFAETRTSAATAAVSAAANTPATGAPTITGTAQVGQTLTAGTTAIMDADGLTTPSYTYQWIRVATDNSETNIASATASTYTLVAADLGTTVKVRVSFTDDASNDETLTSNVSVIIARPANTAATGKPGITGTAQVGQTLTATVGTSADVDGLPNPFLTDVNTSFQWIRVATDNTETNIASATASTYTLVDADLGTTIKVKVGFADYYDYDETLTSDATAAVAASTNTPATGAPTITGTAQVGQTLTAGTTAIMDADGLTSVSYTYQWIRTAAGVDTNISGATASTYTLVAADLGTTIKVRVSFTDDASNAETLTSAATAAVSAAANTLATGAPTITGTAQVGQTLTATVGTIADVDGLPNPFLFGRRHHHRVDPGGHRQHRDEHLHGDGEHLHAGDGGPGHDDQGEGELHRRRQQRRDADQRGDRPVGAAAPDTTPPTLTSATVTGGGEHIEFQFSENIPLLNQPPGSAFTVTADGIAVTTPDSPTWAHPSTPDLLRLRVSPVIIFQGQAVVVTYTDPTAGDDANAIQDTDGNDAATFTTGMNGVPAVTNNSIVTNTPATGAPTITGTAQVGQTLTAGTTAIMDANGLTSVSYTYQWIRTATGVDTNISGATASTYTLVAADLGTTIKVRVSFTDDASNAETLTSAATAAVSAAANTPATGAPTITGTAQVGQVLTATVGTIADVDGLPDPFFSDAATTIAWIRVATDNSETNIASATASTYTLVAADLGTTVKVRVSFTDDASNAETLTSAATAAVSAAAEHPSLGV